MPSRIARTGRSAASNAMSVRAPRAGAMRAATGSPVSPPTGYPLPPVNTPGMWDINRAYELPSDPLAKPMPERDLRIPYRDLPASIATDWDPDLIRQALLQHNAGFFSGSALLVDAIFGDPRVQATLHTRIAALLGQRVTFRAASDIQGKTVDAARAAEALEAWKSEFHHIAPRETLAQFMQWGTGIGFTLAELRWDTELPLWRPILKTWHPQFVWYNVVTRRYIVSTMDGPMEIMPGNGRWVLYTPQGEYRGWLHAAVRAVAIPWLIRQYAQRDWARYSEVHGIPILKAVVPIGGDAEQKERFIEAASNLGQESVVLCPQGIDGYQYDLQMLEATDRSWEAFQGLMDRCDMSIVLAILGQNLTTEVKEGSFAAARVHGDVRQTILEHDEATLSSLVYEQIARPWALYNFGDADLAPMTHWDVLPVEDDNARVAVLRDFALACQAMTSAGIVFDPSSLAAEFGFNVPAQQSVESGSSLSDIQAAIETAKTAGLRPTKESVAALLARMGIDTEDVPKGTAPASRLELAPTDLAKVVRVDEARASQGLPPIGDERGERTLPELEADQMSSSAPKPADGNA